MPNSDALCCWASQASPSWAFAPILRGGLLYAYTVRMEYPYPARGWINREHCYVYLLCVDCDADTLTLQKEEVEDARFFTLDQFRSMTHADRGMMVPHENYYEHIIDTIVKKIS